MQEDVIDSLKLLQLPKAKLTLRFGNREVMKLSQICCWKSYCSGSAHVYRVPKKEYPREHTFKIDFWR